MKIYQSNEIKNIALIGNAGSGKTTLAEAMLFEGGVISRRGNVDDNNTVSDYNPVEHEYGNSVFSTVLYTEWLGKKINFIDTPGAEDFAGGVISALNVVDTGLMLINAQHGIEVGTEILGRRATKRNKPLIFVVNQLDHEKANFEQCIETGKVSFGSKLAIVQYPVNAGLGFDAVIDVLKMKMYKWGPDGGEPKILDIPDSEADKANELHNELVEAAAENDEALMELYFDKGSLTEDEMREGMRKGMIACDLYPVFCVSAKKDMGVRRLMEFIGNIVPFVNEMPAIPTVSGREAKCDANAPTSIFVFKTSIEPHIGEVNYFKVISGKIKEGDDLTNINNATKERLSQLYSVAGRHREKVSELVAGDIGATVKLKNTKNNHTLNCKDCDFVYKDIDFPEPKHRTAVNAIDEADDERLGELLHRMHEEDPTILIEYSKELKQIILHSQGEFHLNTLKWRLKHNDKMEIEFKSPKIPYRETITKQSAADYRHKKQSGGSGQFGEVYLIIEPYYEGIPDPTSFKVDGKEFKVNLRGTETVDLDWGGKLVFCNCIVGGVIDTRFLPAIMKGVMEKMDEGPLTGSYARDIRVTVYDGKMHAVDSNEISFRLAGRHAFSEAFKNAAPKILEPIYDIEILVPEDRMGDVMSDLQTRRAMIMGMEAEKGFQKILAKVPLKEMDRYSTSLSSLTGGRAQFSMKFAEYDKVPNDVQKELLASYEEEMAEV